MAYNSRPSGADGLMSAPREQKAEMVRSWIEDIPLSRPKKHIGRDLADGVVVAEIVRFYLPKYVEIHNYVPSHSVKQKTINWRTLNRKILSKLKIEVPEEMVQELIASKTDPAEDFLLLLRDRIFVELEEQRRRAQAKAINASNGYLDDLRQGSYEAAAGRAHTRLVKQDDSSRTSLNDHHHHRHPPLPGYGTLPPLASQQYASQLSTRTWPRDHARSLHQNGRDTYAEVASAGERPALGHAGNSAATNGSWPDIGEDIAIILEEKEQTILELQETVQLMTVKVRRLEGLLRVKDLRIEDLTTRLTNMVAGAASPERPPRRR